MRQCVFFSSSDSVNFDVKKSAESPTNDDFFFLFPLLWQYSIRDAKYVRIQWKWRVQIGCSHGVRINDAHQFKMRKCCTQRNYASHLLERVINTKTWPNGVWFLFRLHPTLKKINLVFVINLIVFRSSVRK